MMREVYVLVSANYGNTRAYASKKDARDELWQSYMDEFIPTISTNERDYYLQRDAVSFDDSDYIEDWGWIDTLTFVE